eukprot:1954022-Amphidinium_carterae.1
MTRRKRLWRKLRYKLQHGKTHSRLCALYEDILHGCTPLALTWAGRSRSTFKNNLKDDLQRNSSFGWNASLTSWEDITD